MQDYLSSEVFENSRQINRSPGADALGVATGFQKTADPTHRKLQASPGRFSHLLPPSAFPATEASADRGDHFFAHGFTSETIVLEGKLKGFAAL